MEKEILACIDKKNKKFLQSGQVSKYIFPMERTTAHEKKISHLITRFFVLSIAPDGSISYLVQKRGKNKNAFPGYFTDSSSGHVNWEQNLDLNIIKKNALRELEEEFGISPKEVKNVHFYDLNSEGDEIAYIFLGFVDYNVSFNPNEDELDIRFSRFYSKAELKKLLENEKYIDYSKQIWEKLLNTNISSLYNKIIEPSNHNKNKTALFIGRFQPIHHGHIYIINQILKSHNKIKIGIGSSQFSHTMNDPFTSDERREFIKAALEKRDISPNSYELYDIPDIFNANKWVEYVISIVGGFDSVYSNSDWVRELFFNKGIKVEKKISIFKKKFNGNNIRKLIIKNDKKWKNLVPNEVIELIEEFDGINRIKSLNKNMGNSSRPTKS
ncbi:MAG: nicotinamide-nucleotide adenylyltransferase [Candidatus Odinarchaeota archaeon]